MNQILFVVEQNFGNFQSVVKIIVSDKMKSRNDRNSPFPQVLRFHQTIKRHSVFFIQISPDNVSCGYINQIPIVDEFCVFQIQTKYLFLLFVTSSLKSRTSIKTANTRSLWNFEWSKLETSSSEIPRYLFSNYRNTGTRIPKNISPSPFSPFPI